MSDLRHDIDDLGHRLWPELDSLRPQSSPRRGRTSIPPTGRRGRELLATAAAAIVVVGLLAGAFVVGRTRPAQPAATPQSNAPVPAATAGDLAHGHWSVLPPAPIPPRNDPSVVWTGKELLVWGGADVNNQVFADGAAYNPATGRWRSLPPSPLSARDKPGAVWDGSEMVVWGGGDPGVGPAIGPFADGAAYNPQTNTWRRLPPAPLLGRADPIEVWTGSEVLILGGQSSIAIPVAVGDTEMFAYNPSTNGWTVIAGPASPPGHPVSWAAAVQVGGELIAWSQYARPESCPPVSGLRPSCGIFANDLFRYSETLHAWRLVPPSAGGFDGNRIVTSQWTGHMVIAEPGASLCLICQGPGPQPAHLWEYKPDSNSWTVVLENPIGGAQPVWTWTGSAIFSFSPTQGNMFGGSRVAAGAATAYDPSHSWLPIPTAPFGCTAPPSPIWTGHQVLMYCPGSASPSGPVNGGLALTVGT